MWRKTAKTLLLVVAVSSVVGCQARSLPTSSSPPPVMAQAFRPENVDYLPLQQGQLRRYRATLYNIMGTPVGTGSWQEQVLKLVRSQLETVDTALISVTGQYQVNGSNVPFQSQKTIRRLGADTARWTYESSEFRYPGAPPLPFLVFNPSNPANPERASIAMGEINMNFAKSSGYQTVQTSLGHTYEHCIQTQVFGTVNGHPVEKIYFFAPGIGLVKAIDRNITIAGSPMAQLLELQP